MRAPIPSHRTALLTHRARGAECWAVFLVSLHSFAHLHTCDTLNAGDEIPLRLLVIDDCDHYEILTSGHDAWAKVSLH
jgi:hypothetical protein